MTNCYTRIKKNVAFDIGNVLFRFDITPLMNLLISLNIVDNTAAAVSFIGGSFMHSQELGLHTIKQSFYKLNPKLNEQTLQDIRDSWMKTFSQSLPMIDLVEELIYNDYNVALLSNIGPDHAMLVRDNCKIFNKCIQHFSCEVGARKPTRLFFQSFLIQYGWGKEVKYFDDRQDNINIANEYYNGILFDLDNFKSDDDAAKVMRAHLLLD